MRAPQQRWLLVGLAMGLLGACRSAPRAQDDWTATLTEVERLVAEHFHDPERLGSAWRAALERTRAEVAAARDEPTFARALNGLLASLASSHTEFRTRAEARAWELADVFWEALPSPAREQAFGAEGPVLAGIGVLGDEQEGEFVVRGVLEGSPAAHAALTVGTRLLTCEGQTFQPVESFRGRAGQRTRLALRTSAGERREVVLVPDARRPRERYLLALRASARVELHGAWRLAYVHVWSWAGEEVDATLRELLLAGELAGADGLVLDLRDGLGGANPEALALFSRDLPELEWRGRDGSPRRTPAAWTKPVVLLVDERTTSGKEVLAHAFQRARRGKIVGTRTAGAVAGGSVFLLESGALLYLAVSALRVDGRVLEGVGVEPDVRVEWERAAGGADPQLARAFLELGRELDGLGRASDRPGG